MDCKSWKKSSSHTILYLSKKAGEKLARQRDYKREYELAKQRRDSERWVKIGTTVPKNLSDAFKQKAEQNGTKPGTLIREWIEAYLSNRD